MAAPPDAYDGETPLDPVTEAALARLVHLHSGSASAGDRADYEAWKAADPRRAEAGARAERLWTMLEPTLARGRGGRARGGRGRKPLAAVLVTAAGLGIALAAGVFGSPADLLADERTGVGDRRSVILADGSRVDLDTRTSFDVADGGRRLVLHGGQIYVSVAHDPRHPFRVESGGGTVEALGTAFDVRRDGARTTVTVTENAVRVTLPASGRAAGRTLPAGGELDFAPEGLGPSRPADIAERTAWRQGRMRVTARPLGAVLDELGRYRRGAVLFTDAGLRRLPVTGLFSLDDPDALLDAIALALPVKVRRLPWLTIVQPDPDRPAVPSRSR